jgi:hypothetical protein
VVLGCVEVVMRLGGVWLRVRVVGLGWILSKGDLMKYMHFRDSATRSFG